MFLYYCCEWVITPESARLLSDASQFLIDMNGELSLRQWRQPREDKLISDLILVKVKSEADFEKFQSEFGQQMALNEWQSIAEERYQFADVKLNASDDDDLVRMQISYTEIGLTNTRVRREGR